MKIKLQDYGLISRELIKKEIDYNEIMLNKPISNKDYISGRLEAFNYIKDNLDLIEDEFLKILGEDKIYNQQQPKKD